MSAHSNDVKNPGPLTGVGGLKTVFLILAVLGFAAFGGGLAIDKKRAWATFLHNHYYFLSLAIGGLFFAAVQWVTGAMWSAPLRRVFESFTAYMPIGAITFVMLYFGLHEIYIWTDPAHVKGDILLEGKASYLSVPFFMIRNLIALGIWIFFAKKLIGNSVAQDASKDPALTAKNRSMSPVFLILFAFTFTMMAFDSLMSLDPHWFSTMFGVYCFAGTFYSILALTAVLTVWLKRRGLLEGIVNANHLHDLGKFMFAFTVFYAYIGFSQFMLIWYANLPEETGYFMNRMHGNWIYVSVFLLCGKFMTPFFLLLPRDAKRSEKMLMGVGLFMLVAHWIDLLWLVQPEFFAEGPSVTWMEVGTFIGFLGLFGTMVLRFLTKNTVVAIGDPRLSESVHHHHV